MKQIKKVGLKDIAKKAGVSVATVSYVLSKGKNSRIGIAMTNKIKKIAKEFNYQPNQIAQSLKSGKTFTIGLIVADISNPFFANIARIIEDVASEFNYTVIFGSSDEKSEKSMHLLKFLSNRQVDGFILAPTEGSEDQIAFLQEQNIPFVLIDRYFPEIKTNYVIVDNFKASYEATELLIKTGNKRIGMIAYGTEFYHMKQRVHGYEKAMQKFGLKQGLNCLAQIDVSNVQKEVEAAIDSMLVGENRVDALFFATNTLTINGLRYLSELGLKVPNDIRIVNFDAGEAFDFFYCPLTHIKQPLADMGKVAVNILVEQIENPNLAVRQISLPAQLIVRESCYKTLPAVTERK